MAEVPNSVLQIISSETLCDSLDADRECVLVQMYRLRNNPVSLRLKVNQPILKYSNLNILP
jgi:hypothetical protein